MFRIVNSPVQRSEWIVQGPAVYGDGVSVWFTGPLFDCIAARTRFIEEVAR